MESILEFEVTRLRSKVFETWNEKTYGKRSKQHLMDANLSVANRGTVFNREKLCPKAKDERKVTVGYEPKRKFG